MTATAEHPATFRWDRLTYASALGFCMLVAGLSVGVVLGELRDEFGLSGVLAALHGSTFGIGLLIVGTLGVRLVDRVGRRNALIAAVSAIGLGVAMFSLGPAWPITLLGTMSSGLGSATIVMVMPGLISDHHGPHRAAAFAAVNGAPGLAGVAFSLLVGAALAAGISWRVPYLSLTAVIAATTAVVALPVRVPAGQRHGSFSIRPLARPAVRTPWLFIVNAVLTEFTVGIWAVTYLGEVGGASDGAAPVVAAAFPVAMFASRMVLPVLQRVFAEFTVVAGFAGIAGGATVMCLAPGLAAKAVGLALCGFAGGVLYPLTVDGLYQRAGAHLDSVALGAYCALASGVAVTLGPLALGVLADLVGLRWALLVVPALALVGIVTQRPHGEHHDDRRSHPLVMQQ